MDYFLPHKALSLVMLIFFVIAWRQTYRNRTCLTVLPSAALIVSGAVAIWFYPSGLFACDVCEATYWAPYLILPCLVFIAGLGITKIIKSL